MEVEPQRPPNWRTLSYTTKVALWGSKLGVSELWVPLGELGETLELFLPCHRLFPLLTAWGSMLDTLEGPEPSSVANNPGKLLSLMPQTMTSLTDRRSEVVWELKRSFTYVKARKTLWDHLAQWFLNFFKSRSYVHLLPKENSYKKPENRTR